MDFSEYSQGGSDMPRKLMYKLASSTRELFSSRNQLYIRSDLTTYGPNSNNIIKFQISGSKALIDGQNSYLKFDFRTSDGHWTLSGKSASRLIQRVRITAGDGTLISDVNDANVVSDILTKNLYSKDYINSKGSVELMRDVFTSATGTIADDNKFTTAPTISAEYSLSMRPATGYTQVCLPLYWSGFLNCNKLIPMSALGSLSIELTLAPVSQALQYCKNGTGGEPNTSGTFATAADYEISRPELVVDSIIGKDALIQALNDIASKEGLILTFNESFVNTTSTTVGSKVSIQLNKPVRYQRSIFGLLRPSVALNSPDADSFRALNARFLTNYQFFAQSQYFPTRPVSGFAEFYQQIQRAWNHLHDLRYSNYSVAEMVNGNCLMSAEMELDPSSSETGMSSRNNQNIQVDFEIDGGAPQCSLTFVLLYEKALEIKANNQCIVRE